MKKIILPIMTAASLITTLASSQGMATAKMSNITNLPPWQQQNCHLGISEYALLKALLEKVSGEQPSLSSAKTEGADTREVVPSLRKIAPPKTAQDALPGSVEVRKQLATTLDSFRALDLQNLKSLVFKNPLIRACQIFPTGKLAGILHDFTSREARPVFYAGFMPMLVPLQMVDLFSYRSLIQQSIPYEEALNRSVRAEDNTSLQGALHYFIEDLMIYTSRSVEESMDPKDFPLDLGTFLVEVSANGKLEQYQMNMSLQHYSATGLTLAQMIPAELKHLMVFDDSVINTLDAPFFGNSYSSTAVSAQLFSLGDDARESAAKKSTEDCFKSFKANSQERLSIQMILHMNTVCIAKGDKIGFFAPMNDYQLSSMSWENVNRTTMKNRSYNPPPGMEITGFGGEINMPEEDMVQKEYLRASGHDSDFNVLINGKLLLTDRKAFDKKMRPIADKVFRKHLTDQEYQSFVPGLAKSLGVMELMNHAQNGFTIAQYAKNKELSKSILRHGGVGFILSFLEDGTSDEQALQFAYRSRDQKFEIVGLHSEAVVFDSLKNQVSSMAGEEKKQMVQNLLGAPVFCSAKIERLNQVTSRFLNDGKLPTTKKAMTEWLEDKASFDAQAEGTMSGVCLASFHQQSQRELATAREFLKRMTR